MEDSLATSLRTGSLLDTLDDSSRVSGHAPPRNHVEEPTHEEDEDNGDEDSEADENRQELSVALLTRRIRCLFGILTGPIAPLGGMVVATLFWLLIASLQTWDVVCSHPLKGYALISAVLLAYTPLHYRWRSLLMTAARRNENDAQAQAPLDRPRAVRHMDQCFHTVALLYVYGGITLVQTCRQDMNGEMDLLLSVTDTVEEGVNSSQTVGAPVDHVNTCAATCPNVYQALVIYVASLELFTLSLILPLLCLPFIYLWFLRRATNEASLWTDVLRDQLRDDDLVRRNGNVLASTILERLEAVHLVEDDGSTEESLRVWVVPVKAQTTERRDAKDVKECCICMEDFAIQPPMDVESGILQSLVDNGSDEDIVQTRVCGHLYHRRCISSWVGGQWTPETVSVGDERKARRTTCPLCRADLRPPPDNYSA
jgi:hypothetical protein